MFVSWIIMLNVCHYWLFQETTNNVPLIKDTMFYSCFLVVSWCPSCSASHSHRRRSQVVTVIGQAVFGREFEKKTPGLKTYYYLMLLHNVTT